MSKQWRISRRMLLKGLGAGLALPLFDAMAPTRLLASEAQQSPNRMAIVFVPNGVQMPDWTPQGEGRDYQLSPTLQTLAAQKNDFCVLSGLT